MSSPWLDRGGTAQVGGSPLSHIVFLVSLPLFSLTPSAQRKKLSKKETPKNYFAICGWRPTLRALDQRSLFEKSDVKTFNKLTYKPQFIFPSIIKKQGAVRNTFLVLFVSKINLLATHRTLFYTLGKMTASSRNRFQRRSPPRSFPRQAAFLRNSLARY